TRAAGGSRIIAPPVVFDWFWRPLNELPPPGRKWPDRRGRSAYLDLLEGHPARLALEEIAQRLLEATQPDGHASNGHLAPRTRCSYVALRAGSGKASAAFGSPAQPHATRMSP